MTVQEVLQKSIDFLKKKNIESAKLDAEILISESLGMKRLELYLNFERPLKEAEIIECRERIKRRGLGEPVSIVLGFQDFWGLNFLVNKNVLTPRPETEELVEKAVECFQLYEKQRDLFSENEARSNLVVDLGAGSGCIGLTFLKKVSSKHPLTVVMVEKSPAAFEVLLKNTRRIFQGEILSETPLQGGQRFELSRTREIICLNRPAEDTGKIFVSENGLGELRISLLLANPPYIAVGDQDMAADVLANEPHEALFAEDKGMFLLKAWIAAYTPFMEKNAHVFMEMGPSQGPEMKEFLLKFAKDALVHKDLQGRDRILEGRFTTERSQHG